MKMDFVAVKNNIPFIRLSGCSDVIHINGICGRGKKTIGNILPILIKKCWSIDCLRKSKLIRIFSDSRITAGYPLSSFEIY